MSFNIFKLVDYLWYCWCFCMVRPRKKEAIGEEARVTHKQVQPDIDFTSEPEFEPVPVMELHVLGTGTDERRRGD